jgi:hypothetical protein
VVGLSKPRRLAVPFVRNQDIIKLHTQRAEFTGCFPVQQILSIDLDDASEPGCLVLVGGRTPRRRSAIHIRNLVGAEAFVEESRIVTD